MIAAISRPTRPSPSPTAEVYENGAWGKKFRKTYRKEPTIVTPALLAKGVVK